MTHEEFEKALAETKALEKSQRAAQQKAADLILELAAINRGEFSAIARAILKYEQELKAQLEFMRTHFD